MLVRNLWKFSIAILFFESSCKVCAQSLFDELPLNGALLAGSSGEKLNSHFKVRGTPSVTQPFNTNSFTSFQPTNIYNNLPPKNNTASQSHNLKKKKFSKEPSLFDDLPNQGALTDENEDQHTRLTRDFIVNRAQTNDEESFINSHLLPHIRNHVLASPTVFPIITGTESSTHNKPTYYRKGSVFSEPAYDFQSLRDQHDRHHHHSNHKGKPYEVSASAKSGGSTVIVYAHPNNKDPQNQNTEQGASPPAPPPERNSNSPQKNEIHYHYHLPTTSQSSYYDATTRSPERHDHPDHNNHHNPPPQPPPTYGPPSHRPSSTHRPPGSGGGSGGNHGGGSHEGGSHGGGSNGGGSHGGGSHGGGSHGGGSHGGSSHGGTGSYSSSRIKIDDVSLTEQDTNSNFNHRTFFTPSQSYSHNSGWQSDTKTSHTPSSTYEAPSLDEPQPPPSYSFSSHSYDPPKSSYAPPPSQSYRPPPSPSYGPPPSESPPPPLNDPPALPPAPTESHQTSISYQTIPVTHQVTEFVQVPTITQTLINHSPAPQADQPQTQPPQNDQPQSGYGPGSKGSKKFPSLTYSGSSGPGRTLNLQGVNESPSRSVDRSSIAEDQLNRLLLPAALSSRENTLSDLLLLTQAGRGGGSNDLSFAELQLLATATRGGNGFANQNNFQNPLLLPTRGGRGSILNSLPVVNSGFRTNGPLGASNFQGGSFGGGVRNIGFNGGGYNGNQFLGQGQPTTGRDTASAIHELIREQRIQGALSDLRSRLRDQSRGADRERQNYRNLFYKGALLLSALTLLPTVATPMAAAAMANSAGSMIPSFMMPLTIGRRKRSLNHSRIVGSLDLTPFEKCLEKVKNKIDSNIGRKSSREFHSSLHEWLECAEKLSSYESRKITKYSVKKELENSQSLGKIEPRLQNGTTGQIDVIPEVIRDDLQKYLPLVEILKNSKCIQKCLCKNLIAIKNAPEDEKIRYSLFANEVPQNSWISESVNAAKKNVCESFHCAVHDEDC